MGRTAQPDPILGAVLRRLREKKGLTREATAFRAGVATVSLARIELGGAAHQPSPPSDSLPVHSG